jgi:hypothetical protein
MGAAHCDFIGSLQHTRSVKFNIYFQFFNFTLAYLQKLDDDLKLTLWLVGSAYATRLCSSIHNTLSLLRSRCCFSFPNLPEFEDSSPSLKQLNPSLSLFSPTADMYEDIANECR